MWPRILKGIAIALAVVLAIILVAVVVFTSTDFGRERVRRMALSVLRDRVNGQVQVGSVSGNLLRGVTLHDVLIADSSGAPFLAVEEVRTGYGLRALLQQRVQLNDLRLVSPVIVLNRPPEGEWNFARLFASDTTTPSGAPSKWGRWIVLEDVQIVNGRLVVRTPWRPDTSLSAAARDSVATVTVAGEGRSEVVSVEGGYQRVMEFRDIDALLSRVRLAHPDYESRLIAVDSLEMIAEPFRPPVVDVRSLAGEFEFTGDSLWFTETRAALPGSRISGGGRYVFDRGTLDLDLVGGPVALADLRWLYPRLPSEGGGSLGFVMHMGEDTTTYRATNANIAVRDSRLAGDFGLTLADVAIFHDTDLRVADLDTRLIEQLVPTLDIPVTGDLSGTVAMTGPLTGMRVNADVTLDETRTGRSRVLAAGEVGFGSTMGMRASNLRLEARPLQVPLVRTFVEGLPLGGTLAGTALVNGSSRTQLSARADLVHLESGNRSHVVGDARVRFAGRDTWLDVDAQARPVALATVGQFTPIELRGVASGPVRVRGTMRDLRVSTDMRVSGGGDLRATGRLDLASATPEYEMSLGFWVFNLNAVVADAPATSLSATAAVSGEGFDPETMNASLTADVTTSHWSEMAVDRAVARMSVADGLLRVDSLMVRAPNTRLDAQGAFGFDAARTGTLSYRLEIDSLADFARWLPLDTGVVEPRPSRVARAREAAEAEERRLAERTEVERAITGAPAPRVAPQLPPALRRDTVAGAIYSAGTLSGNLDRFNLYGRATALGLMVFGNSVQTARAEYRIAEGGTDDMRLAAAVEAGDVDVAGFAFDSIQTRIAHADPEGDVLVVVRQGEDREYSAAARYSLSLESNELFLDRLGLRFDTTFWASTQPGVVRWGPRGVEVETLELRSGQNGRLFVDGLLPTEGRAALTLAVDNFEIGHLVDLLQADVQATGLLSLSGEMTGTLADPSFAGALGLLEGSYGGRAIPQLNATVQYADRSLATEVVASRGGGRPLATMEGMFPLDLALADVTGPRVLNRPFRAELIADSLPLDVLPSLTDAVTNVQGRVIGSVAARGTLRNPALAGALALDLGSFGIAATGTTVRDINGVLRMAGDSIVVDSLVGWAGGPVRIAGGLDVGTWTSPGFDLQLDARNALLLNNERGRIRADADVTMRGPFNNVVVEGSARVRGGVLYVDESPSRDVVSARDPALFDIVDTSVVSVGELVPEQSPLLRNLRMNVALIVDRDTWVRTASGNIEVYGELNLNVNQRRNAFAVEGSVNTDRGEYTFLSKRFQIRTGSATFIGTSEINPMLQITGNYEVPVPGREALNIRVVIGGTLNNPKLTLESDAQPPISQTDLLSYLAFGRSSSSLLAQSGTGLSGASGGGELVGAGAALAGRQLTGVALGVAVSELEGEASRSAGLDVFNITPGELPPEFWRADVGGFLRGTELEMGRYLNRSTFVAVQAYPDLRVPGARVEYRFGRGFRLDASYETRYLVTEPTLGEQTPPDASSWGAFLIKEWRFSSRLRRSEPSGQPLPGNETQPANGAPPARKPE